MRRLIALLILISLLMSRSALSQDAGKVSDTVPQPLLVWQSPYSASLVAMTLVVGTSPFYLPLASRQNSLYREKIQMFLRNQMNHIQLKFDNYIQYVPLVSVIGLNLMGVPSRHSTASILRRSVTAFGISSAFVLPMKFLVDEMRPDHGARNSFPSGHTTFAFAGAELLRLEYSQTSQWIPVVGFSCAVLTGLMRLYNDRHWTGDVISGAALGVISADLSYYLNNLLDRRLCKTR